jgi:hypothetical protein
MPWSQLLSFSLHYMSPSLIATYIATALALNRSAHRRS